MKAIASRRPTVRNPCLSWSVILAAFSGKILDCTVPVPGGFRCLEERGVDAFAVDLLDLRPILRPRRPDVHEQQPDDNCSGPADVEHTPVAGSTSSTLVAAAMSPASQAVIERTCSYPVARRKVGARP
jgi:hypothetical protein